MLTALGVIALAVMPTGPSRRDRPTARERARAFHAVGLDHWAAGDEQGMLRAMRAAWEADPDYFPPIVDLTQFYEAHAIPDRVWRELDSLSRSPAGVARGCIRTILAQLESRFAARPPPTSGHGDCAAFAAVHLDHRAGPDSEALHHVTRWAARHPESPALTSLAIESWTRLGRWDSVVALAERHAGPNRHPLVQAVALNVLPQALHRLGRHDAAALAEHRIAAFLAGSPPRVRARILPSLEDPVHRAATAPAHADSLIAAARTWLAAAIREGDPMLVLSTRMDLGRRQLDAGDVAASLTQWDAVVEQVERHGSARLRAQAHMRRGRTRVKAGDWAGAERDLLAARALAARQTDLSNAYETEHNLLHLYEAQGRDPEAREAGERFVAWTEQGGLAPVRMMSHHDLGWFLLRRGEREAARRHFEAMVADIDSLPHQNEYPFYAGEYFAAIGELDRAAAYYRRAAATDVRDRTLAGLAALAERTGDIESALRYARESDALPLAGYPEGRPLLPGLLARTGRVAEAVVAFDGARTRARARGQTTAWARLSVELAEMELGRGAFAHAAAVADSAAAAARRVADSESVLRARVDAALARVHLAHGRDAGALPSLAGAVAEARRTGMPQLQADILMRYGDALAAAGRRDDALAAFARAADLTDSIAVSLAHDPTRAGFRDATQSRVSSRALAVIMAHPTDRAAPMRFAEWSTRRKSRGLVAGDAGAAWESAGEVVRNLPRRLGPHRTVVDYAVLDTAVVALVVTNRATHLVHLPVTADTLRARIDALYAHLAPRLGSFVDRSRAMFDLDLARQLYRDVLAPIEPLLRGRTHLTIVPDAPLHLVPFDALVTSPAAAAPAYVLDRYTVSLATALAATQAEAASLSDGPIVAFAGPDEDAMAVGVAREVAEIGATARGRAVVRLDGAAATEAAVRTHAGHAAVLHFATHARPNPYQPDYGHITLAPAGDDDGRLHVHEIRALDLPGSLVVLSACETAAGRLAGGEGPLSLSRAFLQAGATGTVGTLWPVGDAAADLMEQFYRELAAGAAIADALRAAKRAMVHGAHPSPWHWGAFALVTRGI